MHLTVIIRTLGVLLLLFSTTLLPPLALAAYDGDGELRHFALTFGIALAAGLVLWLPLRARRAAIRSRDGFAVVALMWTLISALGAVPFMLALDMSFAAAFFEAASGYTTTGATVIVGLDALPRSILLYRQEIQWLGGIGVIVLAIALLPMLGIGGMQLYKAETPGPFKDERLTPRITRTARNVCVVYGALTGACALAYWFAGMGWFDALAHSLSTLATGGFSTHDASIAHFANPAIEVVAIVFMLIGGVSFGLHFIVWRTLDFADYARDAQVRAFLAVVAVVTAVAAAVLYHTAAVPSPVEALRQAAFNVVSVITTTGFTTADFSLWPLALPALLMFAGFFGGCAGSTSGGMKAIRFVILSKQAGVHVLKLIHPQAVRRIKIDGRVVPDSVVEGIWGFFTIYVGVFVVLMVLVMLEGLDQVTAFGAIATCMNNVGPGLGDVAVTFAGVSDRVKVICAFAMLLGRLEIFTFLVLLTPAFWRR